MGAFGCGVDGLMPSMKLADAVRLSGRLWPGLMLLPQEWGRLLSLLCGREVSATEAVTAVLTYATSDDAAGELGVLQEAR